MPGLDIVNVLSHYRWYIRSAPTNAIVSSDGTVIWRIPHVLSATCSVDIPQVFCALETGSWTYDSSKVR